jgi:hypothetical protein
MGVAVVSRVTVSRKQSIAVPMLTEMSGHVGDCSLPGGSSWASRQLPTYLPTYLVNMACCAVSLGRVASIDYRVQPTRIVARLSAVVLTPLASTLDCPRSSFPLGFPSLVAAGAGCIGAIARKLCVVVG